MFLQMTVSGLRMDPSTDAPLVVLKDDSGMIVLPIWIGASEAHAIAVQLESIRLARPLTHDLVSTLLAMLGGELLRVEIHDLREETFYAALVVRRGHETFQIDSRPSDAIALALRAGAGIFVARKVVEAARPPGVPSDKDPWERVIQTLPDAAYGKWKH